MKPKTQSFHADDLVLLGHAPWCDACRRFTLPINNPQDDFRCPVCLKTFQDAVS